MAWKPLPLLFEWINTVLITAVKSVTVNDSIVISFQITL